MKFCWGGMQIRVGEQIVVNILGGVGVVGVIFRNSLSLMFKENYD